MEDRMKSEIHNDNNFNCKTHWLYRDGKDEPFEEPIMKKAQYEIDLIDEGYGEKLRVKIFSRVGKDPTHKRDFYTYLEFPTDSNFANSLRQFLGEKECLKY